MYLLASVNNYYYGRGGYGYGWGIDPTYLLAILGLVLTLIASARVKSTFNQYAKVRSASGLTGAMAAERILHSCGIYNVGIEHISGNLSDHYDPRSKTLRLSDSTYGSNSIAAICVAAHECGHAVQDQVHYGPLVLRSTLVPAANLGSTLSWPIFLAGLFLSMRPLLIGGIVLFLLAVVFQLITLPVEFNASSRALKILDQNHIISEEELKGGRKVLNAAAMTYVAALASSLLQLLRLIILARGRDRD
ncbi:MAG: zinc metallopeptidase [Lachnospiraceae bacterium]|nr:zinc metallopeptidase [Lachnospiraceae bacterium]